MKIGDLVKYIPSPSSTFKWESYGKDKREHPGIIIEKVSSKGIGTRRFAIRWHDGTITEEWISYLEPFDV